MLKSLKTSQSSFQIILPGLYGDKVDVIGTVEVTDSNIKIEAYGIDPAQIRQLVEGLYLVGSQQTAA